jgi:hypothetical protein
MKTKIHNVSQSLIKTLFDYLNKKECGLAFKAKFIDGQLFPSSDVQKLGQWFEYICTGALPKDGKIPEPVRLKSGEYAAAYERMDIQAKHFHAAMKHYGFKIIKCGVKITAKGMEGTVDVIAKATRDIEIINPESGVVEVVIKARQIVFIDIKSSGLLNDKWNEMGWETESLPSKEKLMIQPVHYKMLGQMKYKTDIPFFFFIHSNTNEVDRKIIHVNVDPSKIDEHMLVVDKVKRMLKPLSKPGAQLEAYPEVKRCLDCPLSNTCPSKIEVPQIVNVNY